MTISPNLCLWGEGISSSIVIARRREQRFFYGAASRKLLPHRSYMRLQRMMGHIPALLHRDPRSVLVVGSARASPPGPSCLTKPSSASSSVSWSPSSRALRMNTSAKRITTSCETRAPAVVNDDARHYVLTTPGTFDVITTIPIHPWVKGNATLTPRSIMSW